VSEANGLNHLLGGSYPKYLAIDDASWKAKKAKRPNASGFGIGFLILILNGCRKNTGAKAQLKINEINPRS
jgi:hypothetical protein